MMMLRLFRRFVVMNAFEAEGGGGGAVETPAAEAQPAATIDTGGNTAPPAQAEVKPASMLDAIEQGLKPKTEEGRARDEQGRFVKTAAEQAAEAQAKAQPKPVEVVDPTKKPEDKHVMPEGLAPDSAKRFQTLVNENKEYAQKLDMATRQVEYVKQTFSEHGIRQDQFEQAASVIGMLNKGDYEGAQRVLLNQLEQIAVMTGKPIGMVDALASHPDLRQKVDSLEMSEAAALQVARARGMETAQQRQLEQQTQQRQSQEQAQREHTQGLDAVDQFCRQMQQADIDYPAIEKILLPQIKAITDGLQPSQWAGAVRNAYNLIKATPFQRPVATTPNVLRPTGTASPASKPRDMREAMFGGAR